ncbi:MAG: S-layer homology domain-containing protein [Candidatus Margulisiibacteriota bacterium]
MKANRGSLAVAILALCASLALAQYTALDPTRIVPDARVLGLGKAYFGLAEGTASIYTNPAGLADAKGWQVTSMSGKFLDEYSYLAFAGYYPTTYGVFGLAYAGTSIGGAFATTVEVGSDPDDPIYTFDLSQPVMGNENSVIGLAYANKVDAVEYLKKLPLADRLAFGTTLKFFNASLHGDSIFGGDASGFDLDFGLKFAPPQTWIKLGAAVQNLLPAALGGKLHYSSGHDESYPASLKLGSAFQVIGKKDAVRALGDHEVKLMLDADTYPTLSGYPWVMHAAVEWKPFSMLAIRAGIDQDAAGDGAGALTTVTDNAFGVGLMFGGFNFDYAYHTFAGMPNVDNHYFSLSYGLLPPVEVKTKLVLTSPEDKLITFDEKVNVIGTVLDPNAKKLTLNDTATKFGLKGEFSSVYDLKFGKNKITASLYDGANKPIFSGKRRALRLITFPDVKIGYWVDKQISLLAMAGVITGYPDKTFRPEGNITRAEMATLIVKTIGGTPEALPMKFKDVAKKHWAAAYIAKAEKLGIVLGYPGNKFQPNGKITRAEGLAMVARYGGISEEVFTGQFQDIAAEHWVAKLLAGASQAGLLDFLKDKPFEPKKLLNRAETVEMLYKTEPVKTLLDKDLLNWESY